MGSNRDDGRFDCKRGLGQVNGATMRAQFDHHLSTHLGSTFVFRQHGIGDSQRTKESIYDFELG